MSRTIEMTEAKSVHQKICANSEKLIGKAATLSKGCTFEAIASLVLSAASIASADGMGKEEFMEAVNIAWGMTGGLRKHDKTN